MKSTKKYKYVNLMFFSGLAVVLTMMFFSCKLQNSGGEGKKVTVTFDLNGGTVNGSPNMVSVTGIEGDPMVYPDGLKTGGLKSPKPLDAGGYNDANKPQRLKRWFPTMPKVFPSDDMQCKAFWEDMEKVTVEFNLNGGSYNGSNTITSMNNYSGSEWGWTYDHGRLQPPSNAGSKTVEWVMEYDDGSDTLLWNRDLSNMDEFFNHYKMFEKIENRTKITYTAKWKEEMRPLPKAIELYGKYYMDYTGWGVASIDTPAGVTFSDGIKCFTGAPQEAIEVMVLGDDTHHNESIMINSASVDNKDLIVPGDGSKKRTFQLNGKTYTFQEVKTFHFEENSHDDAGYVTNNSNFIWDKSQQPGNGLDNNKWRDSKVPVTSASENTWHTIGVQITGGTASASIQIPMDKIGEFDYVEYSVNYYTAGGNSNCFPKIVVKGDSAANGFLLQQFKEGDMGVTAIGFGEWDKNTDFCAPVLRPAGSNSDKYFGSFDYCNARERYLVCGGWNSKDSDDAIVFSQFVNIDGDPVIGNQFAVLYENKNKTPIYKDGDNLVLEVSKDGTQGIRVNFDYLAFYKLESIK